MELSFSTTVVFLVIYFIEAVLILLGNSFTIFVFRKRRAELKRTSYLLVNLAFPDLSLAVSISLLVGFGIRYLATNEISVDWVFIINLALEAFCGAASLFSLMVISLERLYAVRWPFRHRTLSTRSYIYSLAFVWIIAGITFILELFISRASRVYYHLILYLACEITMTSLVFLALVIICTSYILIHQQTFQNIPEGLNELRRAQQNKKLTKTLIIVTVLSLICWIPGIIITIVFNFTAIPDNIGAYAAILVVKMVQYGNSIVNPIVYTFRMPLFKSEIKEIFCKISPEKKRSFYVRRAQQIVPVCQQTTASDVNGQHFDTKL